MDKFISQPSTVILKKKLNKTPKNCNKVIKSKTIKIHVMCIARYDCIRSGQNVILIRIDLIVVFSGRIPKLFHDKRCCQL